MKLKLIFLILNIFSLSVSFASQKHIVNGAINNFKNNPNFFIDNYTSSPVEAEYKKEDIEDLGRSHAKDNIHANILNDNYLKRDKGFDRSSLVTNSEVIKNSQSHDDEILNNYADCSKSKQNNAISCNGQKYCVGSECHENTKSSDFELKHAITKFSVIDSTVKGKPQHINEYTPYIFTGRILKCRRYGYDFANCCNDTGWGNGTFKDCNKQEEELGFAKERQVVIYVGKTKKEGLKKKQKKVYCVFDSKLARIIQEQGRRNQLGIGFGDGENPNCMGISTNQLSALNLDAIDLTPVINDVMNGRQNKDTSLVKQKLMKGVQDQYSDYTNKGGEF